MIRTALILASPMLLAACSGGGKTGVQAPAAVAPPVVRATAGLDRVVGRDARFLTQVFGSPTQDVREENARKLQFSSNDCILDAYLYPPAKGREPVVTYVAARTPDGREAERQSCITALAKRR